VARILLLRTPFLPVERPVTLAPARRR